jgi:hypothetical protein
MGLFAIVLCINLYRLVHGKACSEEQQPKRTCDNESGQCVQNIDTILGVCRMACLNNFLQRKKNLPF